VLISILAIGKLRPHYRAACDEYAKRLGRYARLEEREIREASRTPSVAIGQGREAAALLERLPKGATVVALAREGTQWTSEELARHAGGWRLAARPVAFLVGGSHGLASTVLDRAQVRWSLGRLTLPHELARVVLYEQLYRAFTILAGEPYHKGC
jgi:23S rRNA (pseudouridine1915-N3)-methyltransferase